MSTDEIAITRWVIIMGTPTKSGIFFLLGHICGYNLVWLCPNNAVWNGAKFIHVKYSYLLTYLYASYFQSFVNGVSALGTASIHFIEPGVRINSQYYREDLLMQKLLPDIRQLSDFYVFQQECASP